jgi:2-hydroxy-6-oxonona-2,4-dienedioate hydrolase
MIQFPIDVDGTVTRVLQAGSGDRVVVFVHGLSTRADRWRANLEPLAAAGFRCLAFDLPGHGLAAKPAGFDYTSPGLAAFLGRLLDRLDVPRCALVSTSLGSHIAGWFAVHAPERVSAHLMVDALGLVPIAPANGEGIRRGVRDTSRDGIRAKLGTVFHDAARHVTEPFVEEEWRINNSPGALPALAALGDYVADRLNRDLIGERVLACLDRTPVLLLWGAEDRLVPLSVGQAAAAALPGVTLRVIPDAGHAPYIERADAFEREMLAFLR